MAQTFGWKAAHAVVVNATAATWLVRRHLSHRPAPVHAAVQFRCWSTEALLVAFFPAGLVVLGGMQQWWLQPIVAAMSPGKLFIGAAALTAVTDHAALTRPGSASPASPSRRSTAWWLEPSQETA